MKTIQRGRDVITKLLTSPLDEMGRWARVVRYQLQLWRFCARRLRQHNAMAMSAALSFRTLFALVPMLVLSVILFKPLGYMESLEVHISGVLTSFGVPREVVVADTGGGSVPPVSQSGAGVEVLGYEEVEGPAMPGQEDSLHVAVSKIDLASFIEQKVAQVQQKLTLGRVGPIGVLLLIWTVMTLLTTMERSLNRIFDAPRTRPLPRRVMLYWSVVTFCPLLLATAIYAGRGVRVFLDEVPVLSWLMIAVGWLMPVLVGVATLALIYALMTNTRVKFTAALAGAVFVVPLWLIAKWAFGLYVVHLVGLTKIYGLLGLIPLFVMWVNVSWGLFLFGAEIAHTVQDLPQLQAVTDEERFVATGADAVAVTLTLAKRVESGEGPGRPVDLARSLQLPTRPVAELLKRLRQAGVVTRLDTEGEPFYALTRPPGMTAVADVLQFARHGGDRVDEGATRYFGETAQAITRVAERARGALGDLTLADVMTDGQA
ncbi:MAG TPA: YhjD/YihY/BrkB family envelope integrity protein [Planctomycetota bacterium]|nr:YhjD/YihY/BrkB family envelope integrity protein [Planctomycetota bacterium]